MSSPFTSIVAGPDHLRWHDDHHRRLQGDDPCGRSLSSIQSGLALSFTFFSLFLGRVGLLVIFMIMRLGRGFWIASLRNHSKKSKKKLTLIFPLWISNLIFNLYRISGTYPAWHQPYNRPIFYPVLPLFRTKKVQQPRWQLVGSPGNKP